MAKTAAKNRQGKVVGYLRVSTEEQDTANQELALRKYADREKFKINHFIDITISSRKTPQQRRIDELLESLNRGDTLLVSELSRLGRSVGQVISIIDSLNTAGIRFISAKENIKLNGSHDIQSKMMVTMFSLLAELERDLISLRTKEGLAKARAAGKLLGRPKGSTGKSKLDGKEEEIQRLLGLGVTKANIAKIAGCSWCALDSFIKSRNLKPKATEREKRQ